MKKRIPYGIGDFEKIRKEKMYYVDKTQTIKELENHQYPFFIRPRRFGKSLLISTLENYYDIEKKEDFDELFQDLWIHDNPTEER
ncbi:MAG: AAA family ATPase, partial [Thermotogota bacterium]|nr:AAA family ATPase [Thermotogota bacterium]